MKKISNELRVLLGLLFFDVVIILAHIYFRSWLGFFDLDKEGGLKSVFSGFQLIGSGVCAGGCALLCSKLRASRPFVILWGLLSVLFLYLALDDLAMIHERVGFVLNRITGLQGMFESFNWLIYFGPFIAVGIAVLLLSVRSLAFLDRRTIVPAFLGLVGFFGTLIVEYFGGELLKQGMIPLYHSSIIFEESLLLFGETFFLLALMRGCSALFQKAFILRTDAQLEKENVFSLRQLMKK